MNGHTFIEAEFVLDSTVEHLKYALGNPSNVALRFASGAVTFCYTNLYQPALLLEEFSSFF
jgi:hypothetical protein